MKNKNFSPQGFSLIEILIVVIVISILVAATVPRFNRAQEQARGSKALENLRQIVNAETVIFTETGDYSTDFDALRTRVLCTDDDGDWTYNVGIFDDARGYGLTATAIRTSPNPLYNNCRIRLVVSSDEGQNISYTNNAGTVVAIDSYPP